MVVVQLDEKNAFDHVEHRAAFKAMRLQGLGPISVALIATIWEASRMTASLGSVSSNLVGVKRGLPQGESESPVILKLIMEMKL